MDTDVLLQPIATAKDQLAAWQDVVKANTAAIKEMRIDLGHCNNQEKVQAIINKAELAMQDLAVDSQKIPLWVKQDNGKDNSNPNLVTVAYGQYPVNSPLNPHNPVPWPPDYVPPDDGSGSTAAIAPPPAPKEEPSKKGAKT